MQMSLPIIVTKEGKWFVASCPLLDIASQGKTKEEVKKNITAPIEEYIKDTDTKKPNMKELLALSLTTISVHY